DGHGVRCPNMRRFLTLVPVCLSALAGPAAGASPGGDLQPVLGSVEPELQVLYRELHQHPELSLHEEKTAARLAERLRALGLEVTESLGGTGVGGVLRNGEGPTLLLRTDLDALPVREETGLPYASQAVAGGPDGQPVPVMHACGHDLHMASWIGAATVLTKLRE